MATASKIPNQYRWNREFPGDTLDVLMNDRFRKVLIHVCWKRWGIQYDLADDLVQDAYVFMLTWKYDLSRYTPVVIALFALRAALSEYTKKKVTLKRSACTTRGLDELAYRLVDDSQEQPLAILERNESVLVSTEDIHGILRQHLSPRNADIVYRRIILEHSREEIAADYGITKQAISKAYVKSIGELGLAMGKPPDECKKSSAKSSGCVPRNRQKVKENIRLVLKEHGKDLRARAVQSHVRHTRQTVLSVLRELQAAGEYTGFVGEPQRGSGSPPT